MCRKSFSPSSSSPSTGPGRAGGTDRAYSITETAPLFCRRRKNKRRALMWVQEALLPDSPGPDPPWAYAAAPGPRSGSSHLLVSA